MEGITLAWVARAVRGRLRNAPARTPATGLSIDSRRIEPGHLFVALAGEHTDGHAFLAAAAAAGAAACLCRRSPAGVPAIRVRDPRRALGELAAAYRRRFPGLRVAAVTGSSGKTSTKEMLAAILAGHGPVLESRGNFNNDLGVPLTLAGLNRRHRLAVLELGMSAPGEIRKLARMVRPRVGIITNIGDAHAARFPNRAAVARAKLELLRELPTNGIAVLNADDPLLAGERHPRMLWFGRSPRADVRVATSDLRMRGTRIVLEHAGRRETVRLRVLGAHHALNAAAAVAGALALGLEFSEACRGLNGFAPRTAMRMDVRRIGGHRVINDAYNSNPQSAAAALQALTQWPVPGPRFWVAGSMLELGRRSASLHRELGRRAAESGLTGLVAVGREARPLAAAARRAGVPWVAACDTAAEAWPLLASRLNGRGSVILVKGSRAVGLERLLDDMLAKPGGAPPALSAGRANAFPAGDRPRSQGFVPPNPPGPRRKKI